MAQSFSRIGPKLFGLQLLTKHQNNFQFCQYQKLTPHKRCITSTPKYFNLMCWKCGKERKENFFCENCKVIQKPQEQQNYFNILGIAENFNVDQAQLRHNFRQLQSVLHPDKFSNKTDEEKLISEEYSSLLNKAFSHLQTPLKRAEYMLKLKGESILETQTLDEPDFLLEMMTLNENVEDARTDPDQLKLLNEENKKQLEKLSKDIDDSFSNNDLITTKNCIVRMKYFTSLSDRINQYLRDLGVTD